MKMKNVTEDAVINANREFYDLAASGYEAIDGRRNARLKNWLSLNLAGIRKRCSGGSLLDIGSGSGLVTGCAKNLFSPRVAVDISQKIINANRGSFDFGIVADINRLPFGSESFDAVTCFSVLHHLYNFDSLVPEVARVLKPGGVFYSDHDMDKRFSKRFFIPLYLYRKLHNPESKYFKYNNKITSDLYRLSECQEEGIDSAHLINLFKKEGLSVEYYYHWFGLLPIIDNLVAKKHFSVGWAPLFSMRAIKK